MTTTSETIRYEQTPASVDWLALKEQLRSDRFDNGRSPAQLQHSFENSFSVVFAYSGSQIIGTARALSDGVCNAYIIDMWTYTPFRRKQVASTMLTFLEKNLRGQHIGLFTEDATEFYRCNNYTDENVGMSKVYSPAS